MIDADVAAQDRVLRHHRLAIRDDAFGPNRESVDVEVVRGEFFPFLLPSLDVGEPGFEIVAAALMAAPLDLGEQLPDEGARIGENADIGRIVAAEFGRIEIDVNQLAVREIPRIARQP